MNGSCINSDEERCVYAAGATLRPHRDMQGWGTAVVHDGLQLSQNPPPGQRWLSLLVSLSLLSPIEYIALK